MFTGIVERLGTVESVEPRGPGRRVTIALPAGDWRLEAGASVSVDGCCLTVVEAQAGRFAADLVQETLSRTTSGGWRPGDRVNLERPLRADGRLDGHLVQGHVDGVGTVESVAEEGAGTRVRFTLPRSLARFVAEKGSIAVDGVSLTVTRAEDEAFEVAYIPHTLAVTVAGSYAKGRRVNLEVDVIARHVARLLGDRSAAGSAS